MAWSLPANALTVYTTGYASSTAAPGVGVMREDLLDMIMSIKPWDHPFFTLASKIRANATYVEWVRDEYADAVASGVNEGSDFDQQAPTNPVRTGNWTQIYRADFMVTDTAATVNLAGIPNPYQYRAFQASKALAKAVEVRTFDIGPDTTTNPTYTGAAKGDDPRRMKGLWDMVDWTTMFVDAGTAAITVDHVDAAMEKSFEQGIEPTILMCSQGVKADLSKAFTQAGLASATPQAWNVRGIGAAEKRVVRGVNVYDSEFGPLSVVPNRTIKQTANAQFGWAWLIDKEQVAFAIARDITHKPMGVTGDNQKGIIRGELTLVLRHNLGISGVRRVTT